MSLGSTAEVALERKPLLTPTAVSHAAFVPTGIVTVLLGPALPTLSARWSMNDAQAGQFFTVQFLASLGGNVLSGMLVQRFGYRVVLLAGLLCMAMGAMGLPLSAYHWMGVAAVACYGVGLGLVIPTCNLLVAEVNPTRRAAAVSLLNFSWSVGAVACPFLLAPFQRAGHLNWFFYGLSVFILLVAASLGGGRRSRPVAASSAQAAASASRDRAGCNVFCLCGHREFGRRLAGVIRQARG